jgi:hypothetical protein
MHGRPGPRRRLLGRYDYPTRHRLFEVFSLAVFAVFAVVLATKIVAETLDRFDAFVLLGVMAASLLAFATADFLSGLVHFLCDNLGSPTTPMIGQTFITACRDHHDDPKAMTQGDFIEVNADNFFVCLPILVPCAIWLDVTEHLYLGAFVAILIVLVTVTNELHKWSHIDHSPRPLRALQARRIVLSPGHHQVHHTAPYDSYYCVTSGVLHPLLARVGFWPRLLRVLTRRDHASSGISRRD